MKRKQIWYIDYENKILYRKGCVVYFDETWDDEHAFLLYRNGKLAVEVLKAYNKIIDVSEEER